MVCRGVAASALAALLLACTGCGEEKAAKSAEPLLCYVGGTMRPAMQKLAETYKAKTGQEVQIDSAGSGELLVRIETTKRGDLYVAHDPFLAATMKKGLGVKGWTVAAVRPVIVVRKGNPKNIRGFADLGKKDVDVVLSHATLSTAGWIIPVMAKKAGIEDAIRPRDEGGNVVTRTRGGNAAANQVIIGKADAAVCWNATAFLRKADVDVIEIEPKFRPVPDVDALTTATFGKIQLDPVNVTVATLKCSKQLDAAAKFAEFITSPEAAKVWQSFGFLAVPGTARAPTAKGEIFVHCAAGMRFPIRQLAHEFERKESARVRMTYAGSNMLLGQIDLNRRGDVYIAGDADYIDMAEKKGLVKSRQTICHFVPVIMVQKGNPKGIRTLADLTKPGLKIGQGDPKAAAVGRLTPKILQLNGVDAAAWRKNLRLSTPTVNELGLTIELKTIDGAVVWRCIALKYTAAADIVPIDPAKNVCPEVAGAVLSVAKQPELAASFLEFLASARGRQVLTESGYTVDKP